MSIKMRTVISALIAVGFSLSIAQTVHATTTLRLGHFWPAVAGPHKALLQPWADTVTAQSGGELKVEVYPSSTLSKPPAQYEAVKSRIMDVTATVLGYSANRFPLTQIVELPGLAKNAVHGSCIVQGLYDEGLLSSEFKDTRPLFMFTHGPGLFHFKGSKVKKPEDLAGLRVRRPTTLVAEMLKSFGAQPVGMPAPQSYQSMSRGVIDGVAFPWEGALSFRLNELAESHTEVGGLYTIAFLVTMNKDIYEGLSTDQKTIIDNNSGAEWSNKAGVLFDNLDVKGRAQAEKMGHKIIQVDKAHWKPALDAATKNYLAALEKKGLPALEVHAKALELASSCKQ
jgi:TRAP-type C4-dicarboxylate transport system substrate-binding protein